MAHHSKSGEQPVCQKGAGLRLILGFWLRIACIGRDSRPMKTGVATALYDLRPRSGRFVVEARPSFLRLPHLALEDNPRMPHIPGQQC